MCVKYLWSSRLQDEDTRRQTSQSRPLEETDALDCNSLFFVLFISCTTNTPSSSFRQTLKKAQVDRHLYSCKNCWGVTCVDCNFTFEGDSFRAVRGAEEKGRSREFSSG